MEKMKKVDLLKELSDESGIPKSKCELVLGSLARVVKDCLNKDCSITISGVGTFKPKSTSARTGRNPRTGESVEIGPKKKMTFKPSSSLKLNL